MSRDKIVDPDEISEEDIGKQIRMHEMMNKDIDPSTISKSITFIMLFFLWLFFIIKIESIQIRYALIIIGLPLLLILFYAYLIKKRSVDIDTN